MKVGSLNLLLHQTTHLRRLSTKEAAMKMKILKKVAYKALLQRTKLIKTLFRASIRISLRHLLQTSKRRRIFWNRYHEAKWRKLNSIKKAWVQATNSAGLLWLIQKSTQQTCLISINSSLCSLRWMGWYSNRTKLIRDILVKSSIFKCRKEMRKLMRRMIPLIIWFRNKLSKMIR